MSRRRAGWLAWGLWSLFVALESASGWLVLTQDADPGELFSIVMIGYVTVGALIAASRPGNRVGWLLLVVAVAFSVQTFAEVVSSVPTLPGHRAVAWTAGWTWYVWLVLTIVFLPLMFPTGRLISRSWRPVAGLGGLALGLSIVGSAFKPGDMGLSGPVINPLGVSGVPADLVSVAERLGNALIASAAVLAAVSVVVRFHRSRGVERQQLKLFAYVALITMGGLGVALPEVLFPGGWRRPAGNLGWGVFLFSCLVALPAALGIAILKHRLYNIDVVIKRTLVYGTLTALLVATYLGLVLFFRLVLSPVTGESDLAVAGSTLAVAALFRPLRSRVQVVVDRRFYRARYDASRTLQGFSARLRDELDLEALGSDLRHAVRDTMQPSHVSLWLRETSR